MSRKIFYLLTVVTPLAVHFPAMAQDKKFYIFLSFGQPNMEGNAKIRPEDTVIIKKYRADFGTAVTEPADRELFLFLFFENYIEQVYK
jgi:hypothetical protein